MSILTFSESDVSQITITGVAVKHSIVGLSLLGQKSRGN